MPRIAHRAAYKAADDCFSLSLAVRHTLHWPPDLAQSRHPDVVAHNPLVFTLAGATNGTLATRDQLVSSKAAGYVVDYLRKNAVVLGLDHVSDIVTCESKQHPSFTVTFACANATDLSRVRPVLESLHLEYTWKVLTHESLTPPSDFDDHPFATHLTLPLWTLLDQVILRFVKNGLVRRYPLVFGHLARQLNNEMAYFQPLIISITQILRRSSNPAFRSRCSHLFKIFKRRFTAVLDLDHAMETPGCEEVRQLDCIKAAFVLAMRLVFKASMKIVEFRGHTHIMDVEDHELLETRPPPASTTCPLPPGDIFSEQDDGDIGRNFKESSFFDMLDLPQSSGISGHAQISSTDALPLDTDSEDEYCMFEFPKTCGGDIGLYLDKSDEELSPWSSVEHFVDQSGGYLPSCIKSSHGTTESLGSANSSQTQNGDRIYVDSESFPILSTNDRSTQEFLHETTLTDSHNTQQARSGDTGASQEKSRLNQMGHLEERRLQVARKISQTETSATPTALEREFPLDMDDDYVDLDDRNSAFCQLHIPEDYGHHYSKANPTLSLTNHGFDHEDFLDIISEELLSDEELDLDGLFDREESIGQVNSVEGQTDTVDSACEGLILEDDMRGPDTKSSACYLSSFLQQKVELHQGDWGVIGDCSGHGIDTDFMELAM